MFKRKKILIVILVLVMMLAMSVTAFAASRTCSLSANQTGAVYTDALNCDDYTHYSGYNSMYSTNDLVLKQQWQNVDFSWSTADTRILDPKEYVRSAAEDVSGIWGGMNFRTKIYSYGYTGGAIGTGCVFDY